MKAMVNGFVVDREDEQYVATYEHIRWGGQTQKYMRKEWESKYEIYFFDFDGVLTPHRGSKKHVNIPEREHMLRFINENEPGYLYRPCKSVQDFIQSLDPQQVFVLGAVSNSFESHLKEAFIEAHYPEILPHHIIWVAHLEDKVAVVQAMYNTWMRSGKFFAHLERFRQKAPSMNTSNGLTSIYAPPDVICMVDDSFQVLEDFESHGFSTLHNSEFL